MKFSSLTSSFVGGFFYILSILSFSFAWSFAIASSISSGLITFDIGSDVLYISSGSLSLGTFLSDSKSFTEF